MRYQRVSADEFLAALRLGSESIVRQLVLRDPGAVASRDAIGVSAVLQCLYDWNFGMLEILLATCPVLDIFEAAALGKLARLEELLCCSPELARAWSPDGVTALHLACFYGQDEAVRRLLDTGADPSVRARDQAGRTPLEEAATTGQMSIVRLLSTRGAEPSVSLDLDWPALRLAANHAQ